MKTFRVYSEKELQHIKALLINMKQFNDAIDTFMEFLNCSEPGLFRDVLCSMENKFFDFIGIPPESEEGFCRDDYKTVLWDYYTGDYDEKEATELLITIEEEG